MRDQYGGTSAKVIHVREAFRHILDRAVRRGSAARAILLGVGGAFLLVIVGPIIIATIGYLFVRPATRAQSLVATVGALALAVGVWWFVTRVDDSVGEALIAVWLVAGCAIALIRTRRRAERSRAGP